MEEKSSREIVGEEGVDVSKCMCLGFTYVLYIDLLQLHSTVEINPNQNFIKLNFINHMYISITKSTTMSY